MMIVRPLLAIRENLIRQMHSAQNFYPFMKT